MRLRDPQYEEIALNRALCIAKARLVNLRKSASDLTAVLKLALTRLRERNMGVGKLSPTLHLLR